MTTATRDEFLTLHEFVRRARHKLNDHQWHYINGGSETESAIRRSRWPIDRLAPRPRMLRDASKGDPSVDWFGHRLRLPFMFAP